MTEPWAQPGIVLADKYQLVSTLGRGGMGAVWRAKHLGLGSEVAVKLIDERAAQSPDALERFYREAKAAAALRSPHVVQVLDFGDHGGVPFIVMELLEGESLAQRLSRVGRLSFEETRRIVLDVARAIQRAHESGVVHRDLKPDNIHLQANAGEEIAKVLDFGIAKVADPTISGSTQTGAVLGTPYYMSPEQARGTRAVDHRTDLWALGVISFECVTGARPFDGQVLGDLLLKICAEPAPMPSQLGAVVPGFDEWFARATERDLDRRFQSAAELSDALKRVGEGAAVVSLAPAQAAPPKRSMLLPLLLLVGGLAVVAVVLGGGALWLLAPAGEVPETSQSAAQEAPASPVAEATGSAAAEAPRQPAKSSPNPEKAARRSAPTPAPAAASKNKREDVSSVLGEAEKARLEAKNARERAAEARAKAEQSRKKALESVMGTQ